MKLSITSSAFWRFPLEGTFYRSRRICLCLENRTPAASLCSSHIRSSHLPWLFQVFLRALRAFRLRIFRCLLIMNICFYRLLFLHCLTSHSWSIRTVYTFDFSFLWLYSDVCWLWISVFIDYFFCIVWPHIHEVLELFTLSISLFFDFISSLRLSLFLDIINPFCGKRKRELLLFNWIFSRYFRC